MFGNRLTDRNPGPLRDEQMRTRLKVLGWGLAGGLFLIGVAAANSDGASSREEATKQVFEVETDDGDL
jgi:hypothetical protein